VTTRGFRRTIEDDLGRRSPEPDVYPERMNLLPHDQATVTDDQVNDALLFWLDELLKAAVTEDQVNDALLFWLDELLRDGYSSEECPTNESPPPPAAPARSPPVRTPPQGAAAAQRRVPPRLDNA